MVIWYNILVNDGGGNWGIGKDNLGGVGGYNYKE